jgi:processive 1,2-diacylglycerol beta-glucosyltransferase
VSEERVLILSSKYGEGHFKAGEALTAVFESGLFSDTIVRHLDFGSFFYKKTDFLMKAAYMNMVKKTPEIWKLIYEKTAGLTAESCGKFVAGGHFKSFLNYVQNFNPDVIVNTHFIPAGILAEFKRKNIIDLPVATVVTDYLVHGVWIHSGIDRYLVGCADAYAKLRNAGIDQRKISLTGIPVRPCFEKPISQACAREKLGLNRNQKTILVMGGMKGLSGKDTAVIDLLKDLQKQHAVQFLIVCGSDEELYKILAGEMKEQEYQVRIYRYVHHVQDLMAAADLLITKGGALTISEALTIGLPMIIYKPIPGHENGNAQFVEKAGAGIKVNSLQELVSLTADLIRNGYRVEKMRRAAVNLLPGQTAARTAKDILELARECRLMKEQKDEAII